MSKSDSNGSYPFFGTIIVTWTYNAAKQQLTVTGTVSGKPMTTAVLKPTDTHGTITGVDGTNAASVGLLANFDTDVLGMAATQTQPSRNGNGNSSF